MDRLYKIDTTVVSHAGMGYSDTEDNFFINGRYMYEYERDNIQVSIENQDQEFILAVSDGMDRISNEKSTSISMMKELKKFHEKIRGTGGDLLSKLVQMKERVEEVNNVIYSMSIGSQQIREKATAFAGVFILDGKAAALSSGKCKVYFLRDESIKLITGDGKKAERLLKMGIITSEQAKALTDKVALGNGDGKTELHKSDIMDIKPNDVFMICTDGISNALDDEKIHEIMSTNKDTGYIANLLIKEALKKGEKGNMTALVARVKNAGSGSDITEKQKGSTYIKRQRQNRNENNEGARTVIAAVIACIIVIGVLSAVFYRVWVADEGQDNAANNTVTFEETVTDPNEDVKQETTINSKTEESVVEEPGELTDDPAGQDTEVTEDESPGETVNSSGETEYIVKTGDNLQKISKKYYDSYEKYKIIMERNKITNPNQLKVGETLIIPKE